MRCCTRVATSSEWRTSHGVVHAVRHDTATATGNTNDRVAPVVRPRVAMMNENSPIWARLIPARSECWTPLPARKPPSDTPAILPTSTATVRTSTGAQCSATSDGSISTPIETKKIAAKMSRSGRISCSTFALSPDSATIIPARKAPSATE
jgi:hypothetical protein